MCWSQQPACTPAGLSSTVNWLCQFSVVRIKLKWRWVVLTTSVAVLSSQSTRQKKTFKVKVRKKMNGMCGWILLTQNRFTNTEHWTVSRIERERRPSSGCCLINPPDLVPVARQPDFVFSIFIYRNISFGCVWVSSGWVIIYSIKRILIRPTIKKVTRQDLSLPAPDLKINSFTRDLETNSNISVPNKENFSFVKLESATFSCQYFDWFIFIFDSNKSKIFEKRWSKSKNSSSCPELCLIFK